MKVNLIGLIVTIAVSFVYLIVRASGLYVVSGINLDLTVMMIVSLLIPFFISQLLKRKFPYLLLIVLYIWWNNFGAVEAKSDEDGKYLVYEKQLLGCCDKDLL
ncbi:hypothetical protein HOO54_13360 [Bacillus sp. WMMC1349]|uniref:hypothetical protein n=1 Tax=Bacillus sp. WMMC1349 TaxID=2736254 RepID=UPI001553F3DE|nr:hypothetical protein [Bacillus sp. WMMC1349]NPC93192.1 hypothetical protein [Bacillus sp. WMMC1349]